MARLASLLSVVVAGFAAAAPRDVPVRFVFVEGFDAERPRLEAFASCLFERSNLESFWSGDVSFRFEGSARLAPPAAPLDATNVAAWLEPQLPALGGDLPALVAFVPARYLGFEACGLASAPAVAGRKTAVAFVRTEPTCWPATPVLRNATQLAVHGLAESVDTALGLGSNAGDGVCAGEGTCAGACGNLTGLACPGAPTASPSGCGATPIDGWVVQRLSHEARTSRPFSRCVACDFTLEVCRDAGCRPPCGCAASGGCLVAALLLLAKRRRARASRV